MKLNFALIALNILLCTILLADGFILPSKVKNVSITEFNSKYTKAKRTAYYNYFIHISDGSKYEVSETLYRELKVNDSIKIFSSTIIKMPIKINYWHNSQSLFSKIGELNTQESEKIGLIISLLISLILLILQSVRPFSRLSPYFAVQIIAFGMSGTIFLFVIIEVCSI